MSKVSSAGVEPALGPLALWRSLTPPQRSAFLASDLGWTVEACDFFILVLVGGVAVLVAAAFVGPEARAAALASGTAPLPANP